MYDVFYLFENGLSAQYCQYYPFPNPSRLGIPIRICHSHCLKGGDRRLFLMVFHGLIYPMTSSYVYASSRSSSYGEL
jgi:hypothetical protein